MYFLFIVGPYLVNFVYKTKFIVQNITNKYKVL